MDPLPALLVSLSGDRAALCEAVGRVPADRQAERPAPDRWSVAEILDHLVRVETRTTDLLDRLIGAAPVRGADASGAARPLNRAAFLDRSRPFSAPDFVRPDRQPDPEAAWASLEQARVAFLRVLERAAGRDLSVISRPHPAAGPLDGYQWIASIGAHEARHTAQILEIADHFTRAARSS